MITVTQLFKIELLYSKIKIYRKIYNKIGDKIFLYILLYKRRYGGKNVNILKAFVKFLFMWENVNEKYMVF